jgi:hypothetical protein
VLVNVPDVDKSRAGSDAELVAAVRPRRRAGVTGGAAAPRGTGAAGARHGRGRGRTGHGPSRRLAASSATRLAWSSRSLRCDRSSLRRRTAPDAVVGALAQHAAWPAGGSAGCSRRGWLVDRRPDCLGRAHGLASLSAA